MTTTVPSVISRASTAAKAEVTWNPDQKVIYDVKTPITPTGGVVGLRGSLAPEAALRPLIADDDHGTVGDLARLDGGKGLFLAIEDLLGRHTRLLHRPCRARSGRWRSDRAGREWRCHPQGDRALMRGADILGIAPQHAGLVIVHARGPARAALVENGDAIRIDAEAGTIDLLVEPSVLDERRARWTRPASGHQMSA
jgi:dihydroxy-acid dehydratase